VPHKVHDLVLALAGHVRVAQDHLDLRAPVSRAVTKKRSGQRAPHIAPAGICLQLLCDVVLERDAQAVHERRAGRDHVAVEARLRATKHDENSAACSRNLT
jgi:hypothetical protein